MCKNIMHIAEKICVNVTIHGTDVECEDSGGVRLGILALETKRGCSARGGGGGKGRPAWWWSGNRLFCCALNADTIKTIQNIDSN